MTPTEEATGVTLCQQGLETAASAEDEVRQQRLMALPDDMEDEA